jgi:FkbM family methyltransferase
MIKFLISKIVDCLLFFSFQKRYALQIYLKKILENRYYEKIIKTKKIYFFIDNYHCLKRYSTILTKEKKTITWLNRMKSNDILWDIGANVGIYSLYAAIIKRVKVISFEPMSNSYNVLLKNININNLSEKIYTYPIALGDKNRIGFSIYNSNHAASARHLIINSLKKLKRKFESIIILKPNFFKEIPQPSHIKIDTDGNEIKILKELKTILKSRKTKEICIEIEHTGDFEKYKKIIFKILKINNFINYDYERLTIGCNYFFKRPKNSEK